jgi:hypothetical protein
MPKISFPKSSKLDDNRRGITFPVDVDDERLICFMSAAALCECFGAKSDDRLRVFEQNRSAIEAVARGKIGTRSIAPSGQIEVLVADF